MTEYYPTFSLGLATLHAFWTINVFPFHEDVEKFADPQVEKVESSGDSADSEGESHPLLEKFSKKRGKKIS